MPSLSPTRTLTRGTGRRTFTSTGGGGGGGDYPGDEYIRDLIGGMFQDSGTVDFSVSDVTDAITADVINMVTYPGDEFIQDMVAGMLVGGADPSIDVTYNDGANTITLETSAPTTPYPGDEFIEDLVAGMFTAGADPSVNVVYNDGAATITLSTAAATASAPAPVTSVVYRTASNTVAIRLDGTIISNLATSAANNVTVIQAAIDAAAGTQSLGSGQITGHSGGGTIGLAPVLFDVASTITLKYGVSLCGSGYIDRAGLVNTGQTMTGTTLRATSALTGAILNWGATASVTRSTTNPHGQRVYGINFGGYASTSSHYGIYVRDTGQYSIERCAFNGFRGTNAIGVRVASTLAPDLGSLGGYIGFSYFTDNDIAVSINGTGSTDGMFYNNRMLQSLTVSADIGSASGGGGWQVIGSHWTSGSDCTHLIIGSSPTMVLANYFDTTGSATTSYHIDARSSNQIVGNHFKNTGGGGPVAPIYCSNTGGRKTVCVANTSLAGSNYKALVRMNTNQGAWVVACNHLDNTGGALIGAVVDNAGTTELRPRPYVIVNQGSAVTEGAATFTALGNLTRPVVSARKYLVQVWVMCRANLNTAPPEIRLSGPAMNFSAFQAVTSASGAANGTDAFYETLIPPQIPITDPMLATAITGTQMPTSNTDYLFKFEGLFTPTANGTITMQGRGRTAGQNVTFEGGSTMLLWDTEWESEGQYSEFNISNDLS